MPHNKVVFVTGAGGGIGLRIGETFAEHGAKVVLCDIAEDKVKEAAARISAKGLECSGVQCDVTDESALAGALDFAYSRHGRIDVLINNAGMQHVAMLEDFPAHKFEQMIKLMLTAPFMAIKHVLPIMKRQRFGRIINIASINGIVGFAGKAAYNSAKHGVIGLTKVAALESAEYGITVNALCPGYVDTPLVRNQLQALADTRQIAAERALEEVIYPLVPQRRLLDVEEVADYALFLAGEKARGVTGQAIVIDGGYTAQ
ncbi:3-hydroxybutyrate dehydrogenase [Paenibacillus hemerocallicola]|jgi:3-hydroxybutyrate dehydrogenase|uniref:3-hydroxybutyrate dehydrogenase n=1 Tax=Paenibacillus hemerocallicola TaxID=1172614 RepID=A0A5C4T5R6_9BACL|nr:3-hydroxybutyrate dehydrogenase [Paenibacillus hemerocallicola]TNJ63667.1 3-hydroxybutyrate dehydrogenase [Paenibacillus hemerocallicola]